MAQYQSFGQNQYFQKFGFKNQYQYQYSPKKNLQYQNQYQYQNFPILNIKINIKISKIQNQYQNQYQYCQNIRASKNVRFRTILRYEGWFL